MFKKIFLACGILFVSSAAFSETAASVIDIKAPVIDSQVTKNDAAQVFMQLKNNGTNNYELVAATSPAATKIQLHEPEIKGTHASIKILRNIDLPKNTEKDLQLGSLHVMLLGLKKSLTPGESVPLTLIFNDGSWTTVNATVN